MTLRNLAQGDCLSGGSSSSSSNSNSSTTTNATSDLDWGTSFAFSAICCAAAIILFFSPKGCHRVVPSYFLATGISYAVLGLRQILDAKLSPGLQEALEMTSDIFYGLGTILLLVLSMMMVSINPQSESKVKMLTFWGLVGIIAGFMLVSIFLEAEMESGVPLHASLSFGLLIILMAVYMFHMCYDRTKVWHYIAKALAVLIIAIEVLYSTIIASTECQKCSSSCQYSSTGTNAVVHDVVLFFGFSIFAWGEDTSPSVTARGFNQYDVEGVVEDGGTEAPDTSVSDWASEDGGLETDIEGSTYGDDQQQLEREEGKEEENEVEGEDEVEEGLQGEVEVSVSKENNNVSRKKGSSTENNEEQGDRNTSNVQLNDEEEIHDV
ncbi:unnamed protein product [Cylindrotheca closterium]|uniref:Transmembrane protein n=1 Tax=Cylindrotheca closterium TaxID=2856 RepID=A0AAD2CK17_9STRA|nr:unnamed protein product [Cylindrotheca closterium]